MLPKWHLLFGAIFSLILYLLFSITIFQASLIFLSSVLIDFDHYLWAIKRKKYFSLKEVYLWNKNLPKKHKPIMHIFHSIEFIVFIAILSFYFDFFLFILIGIVFHSLLDIIELIYEKRINCREFSLIRFLILRKKYPQRYF
jgi:hypothetical protein